MPNTTPRRDPETDDALGLAADLVKLLFAVLILPGSWLVLTMGGAEALKGWF
ncbi:hypothetical protein GGQ99_004753 [Aminobacter niigataensis]|uniref:Uncharacterized protein n=1 Tax=Aminobacter niigataensis TaxID=83265 RepID=A0ABR6L837_9HYPH|nr:hypothetical protein [Aminobacter niigataensis]MBB4652969.1 hypothetical protein [Aminobacter niigataensis]